VPPDQSARYGGGPAVPRGPASICSLRRGPGYDLVAQWIGLERERRRRRVKARRVRKERLVRSREARECSSVREGDTMNVTIVGAGPRG
jgi:hypothetical protein